MNRLQKLTSLLFCVLLVASAMASELDPRIKPGNRFVLEFPELGVTDHGGNMRMEVYIPLDYNRDKKFPMLLWITGGWGTHKVDKGIRLVGDTGWIIASVPYRKSQKGYPGHYFTPIYIYKMMLEQVDKLVPNIDPRMRVSSGYSSGGVAVCHGYEQKGDWYHNYFYAFMVGGVGGPAPALAKIKGRPMLIFVGDKDDPRRLKGLAALYADALKYGVKVERLWFKDVGHSVPDEYIQPMRDWIRKKVLLRDLPEYAKKMRKAQNKKKYDVAAGWADKVISLGAKETAEHKEATELLGTLEPIIAKGAEQVLKDSRSINTIQKFIAKWGIDRCPAEIINAGNEIGKTVFGRIMSKPRPSVFELRKFLKNYEGLDIHNEAMVEYEKLSAKELELMSLKSSASSNISKLERFIDQWKVGKSIEDAREKIREINEQRAPAEFSKLKKIRSIESKAKKAKAYLETYGETSIAKDAMELLETTVASMVKHYKRMSKRSRLSKLKLIVKYYGDLKASVDAHEMLIDPEWIAQADYMFFRDK